MSLSSIASPLLPPINLESIDKSSDRSSSAHGSTSTHRPPDYIQRPTDNAAASAPFQTAGVAPKYMTRGMNAVKMEPVERTGALGDNSMPPQITPAFGTPAFGSTDCTYTPYMVPTAHPFVQPAGPPQTVPHLYNPNNPNLYQAMPMTGMTFNNPALPPTPDTTIHSFSPPAMNALGTQLQMGFSPTTTIDTQLISPVSALSSQLSDLSPGTNSPWLYSPAGYFASSTPSQTAALPQSTPPTGTGMGFVNGYPYPIAPAPTRPALRVLSRKSQRGIGSDSPHSPRRPEDDDEDELVDIDEAQKQNDGGSLGFTPVVTEANERIAIPARLPEVRSARIESEQRRRNELKQGFERLRDALPPSNQRVSKALLLDRGVAHIQSLDAANRYLSVELENAKKDVDELRRMNHQLAQSLAAHTRTPTPVK